MKAKMCWLVVLVFGKSAMCGDLTPPAGPVSPTPGPEPRTAVNAANTPGDIDSTFRIAQPGSYYLEGNVTAATGKSGIAIESSNVTLDLNGFTVFGVAGASSGIRATSLCSITVRNGVVRDFPLTGITLLSSADALLEQVHCTNNGTGFSGGGESIVIRGCTAVNNDGVGFNCGQGTVIEGTTSRSNASHGYVLSPGTAIVGCSASNNEGDGIRMLGGGVVDRCAVYLNDLNGIHGGEGASITGCSARFNLLDGIRVVDSCTVRGNTCHFNGPQTELGAGINVTGTENRIEGNNCVDNDFGVAVGGTGNLVFGNSCRANILNYSIIAGNRAGPVVLPPVSGAVSGNSGAAGMGTTDPWANFAY
jgi:hypothetical protein